MRLALDGRVLQSRPIGGIGRIVRAVLPELGAAGVAGIDLLVDDRLAPPDLPSLSGIEVHSLRAPLSGRGVAWLELAAPRWLAGPGRERGVDVFHCPFYGLPRRQPVPMVVSIYDTTFLGRASWVGPARRGVMRMQSRVAARTAATIITGSETVAGAISHQLRVDPSRIVVAAPGPDAVFLAAGQRETQGERAYVAALGGTRRRNLPVAIKAWHKVRSAWPDLGLLVLGTTKAAEGRGAESAGAAVTGPLDDAELARLLSGAVAFLYPTTYEGVGLPALEAMAAGTPVVCAPVGALPEVIGDAAEWCARPTVEDTAAALRRVLEDPGRRAGLARAGRCRAGARPGPAAMAAVWADAYRGATRA